MDILAYGEKNFTRNQGENDKKYAVEPCRVKERERERERGKFEKFLKKCFEQVKSNFLKPYSRVLIDRKPVLIN